MRQDYYSSVSGLAPDLQMAVDFLTGQVQALDQDDYKKLGRVMKYLRATKALALTLKADNLHLLKWWINGVFATHNDMQSHPGRAMSLGQGCDHGSVHKEKVEHFYSSNKAELVVVDDCNVLHSVNPLPFLDDQGLWD